MNKTPKTSRTAVVPVFSTRGASSDPFIGSARQGCHAERGNFIGIEIEDLLRIANKGLPRRRCSQPLGVMTI